jgi:hypothetical protein
MPNRIHSDQRPGLEVGARDLDGGQQPLTHLTR